MIQILRTFFILFCTRTAIILKLILVIRMINNGSGMGKAGMSRQSGTYDLRGGR